MRVSLQYRPPGGELMHMVAALFGEDPGGRIEEDLTRLKDALGHAHEDRDAQQAASIDALPDQPHLSGLESIALPGIFASLKSVNVHAPELSGCEGVPEIQVPARASPVRSVRTRGPTTARARTPWRSL